MVLGSPVLSDHYIWPVYSLWLTYTFWFIHGCFGMSWPLTWPWPTHSPSRYSVHLLLCQNTATNSAWQVSECATTKANSGDRPSKEGLEGKLGPGVQIVVYLCPLRLFESDPSWTRVWPRLHELHIPSNFQKNQESQKGNFIFHSCRGSKRRLIFTFIASLFLLF